MKIYKDPKKIGQLSDRLYKKYGKPLEKEHWGEFLAVSQKGKTLLDADLLALAQKASKTLGSGNFLFKVGEKAVGKWR